MKKNFCFLVMIIMILISCITAFAGNIPEELLSNDDAKVFFAKILSYNSNGTIKALPVEIVKGDVKMGVDYVCEDANIVGDFKIKKDKVYLFADMDDNNPTDIFLAEFSEGYGIKLKNIQGDMWERFEKYLNDGEYFKEEQERRQKLGLPLLIDNPLKLGKIPFLEVVRSKEPLYLIVSLVVIFIIGIFIGFFIKKNRSK